MMYLNEYIKYKLETKPYQLDIPKDEYIKLIEQNESLEEHFKKISEIERICNKSDWD